MKTSPDLATRRGNRERLLSGIPDGWRAVLQTAIEAESFGDLADYVAEQRSLPETEIYPAERDVFRALQMTRLDDVRAVILGQDPYYTEGLATGLAFSVPEGKKLPRSLQNILKARQADLSLPVPASGALEPWARNGVLLLNTALTVRRDDANSHRGVWKPLTDAIVNAVSAQRRPIVFLLWGRQAQQIQKRVRISDPHDVIESVHPAARKPGRPFVDSMPFRRADARLGRRKIDWRLSADP